MIGNNVSSLSYSYNIIKLDIYIIIVLINHMIIYLCSNVNV
ncbi:hypothetical protein OUHCRE10_50540 [Enterobacter hormaechei subsp. xiangfangensis]